MRPPFANVNSHTLANRDARAVLTYLESVASGRVHRLDQCMRNIPANLFDSKSFTLKPAGRYRLTGIFTIIGSGSFGDRAAMAAAFQKSFSQNPT